MKLTKNRKFIRRKELTAAISLVLAATPMAYAQDTDGENTADQNEEMVMEEVVVTGRYRASLIDAIGIDGVSFEVGVAAAEREHGTDGREREQRG